MKKVKQTATDWLYFELVKRINPHGDNGELWAIHEQAEAMHKEQIIDAHLIGLITSMEMEATKQAEQYYNETFKSE